MFKNIGGKIKTLVKIVTIIELIIICAFTLVFFILGLAENAGIAFSILLIGAILFFAVWVSSWVAYGFGELVESNEKTKEISIETQEIMKKVSTVLSDIKRERMKNTICIGMDSYKNQPNAKHILLPAGTITIGARAFTGRVDLESVVIPSDIQRIGIDAFAGCNKLYIFFDKEWDPYFINGSYNPDNRPIYWKGEWQYDTNGHPVVLANRR